MAEQEILLILLKSGNEDAEIGERPNINSIFSFSSPRVGESWLEKEFSVVGD